MNVPDPQYRNSAGRLLTIFNSLSGGRAYKDTVPQVLSNPAPAGPGLYRETYIGLAELQKLYGELEQDLSVTQIGDQTRAVMLKGLASLHETVYPQTLDAGFRTPTTSEYSLLELAATIIPQEGAVERDDTDAIRDSVSALRRLVQEADVSPTLRKVLLELIRLTDDAMSRFNIHGAKGLREAFKRMLGEVAEAYGVTTGEPQREEVRTSPAWAAIMKHLHIVDAVGAKLLQYKPLLDLALPFLLGGPQAK